MKRWVFGGHKDPLNETRSLDEPLTDDGDGSELGETVPDPGAEQDFTDAAERIANAQLRASIDAAMKKNLNPQQASIVDAFYLAGKPASEIAADVGCSCGALYRRLRDCMKKMRRDERLKELRKDYIGTRAYRRTGLQAFRENGASSPELLVEEMEERFSRYCDETEKLRGCDDPNFHAVTQ